MDTGPSSGLKVPPPAEGTASHMDGADRATLYKQQLYTAVRVRRVQMNNKRTLACSLAWKILPPLLMWRTVSCQHSQT